MRDLSGRTKTLGTLGGGQYNMFSCRLASGESATDSRTVNMVKEILEMYAPRVSACLVARGWTAEPLATRQSGKLAFET